MLRLKIKLWCYKYLNSVYIFWGHPTFGPQRGDIKSLLVLVHCCDAAHVLLKLQIPEFPAGILADNLLKQTTIQSFRSELTTARTGLESLHVH